MRYKFKRLRWWRCDEPYSGIVYSPFTFSHQQESPDLGSSLPMFRTTDLTLLLMLFALFVFHSPFTRWWTGLNLPWYTVFLLWFVVILLVAIHTVASGSRGGD